MKISKLFHWLYATLMFLPLLFLIPTLLYYGFNEHATNTETTSINYKYESNEVNSLDDLLEGNIYHFKVENQTLDEVFRTNSQYAFFGMTFININQYDFSNYTFGFDEIYSASYENNGHIFVSFNLSNFEMSYSFYAVFNDANDPFISGIIGNLSEEVFTLEGDFIYFGSTDFVLFSGSNAISYTDYNVIESVSVNTDDTITDKVNRSFEQIFNLPVFSWTKTTFVSAGFVYIGGLFGITESNPITYLFAYFVTISICWLVFDLLMYVPNLAHRWLDRSSLQ